MADLPKPDQVASTLAHKPPQTGWMDTPVSIREGIFCYAGKPKNLETVGLPNPREWHPLDDDWKLPENWKEIIFEGMRERLDKFRTFHIFMDICVRCGACADKCHFFIGGGDPKNMPVLRAELLRSVYRREFTKAGKIMGRMAGARDLTEDVLKEWWYYFFQCTECRRCSLFCPYGIDTAEITIIGRELLNLIGLNTDWISAPVANCYRTGNHLGIQPHAFKDMIDFFCDDIEEITGVRPNPSFNRKGAEILFITAVWRCLCRPGHLYMHGLPYAVPLFGEHGTGHYMEHLCFRGRKFWFLHLSRNDEEAQFQNVCRSKTFGR